MCKLPNWLPSEVQKHAESLIQIGGLGSLEPTLLRLVTSPQMEGVWKKLNSLNDKSQKLIDFLEYVRLHSTLHGANTEPIAIPSDKVQRRAFKQLRVLSKRMISEMRNLSPSNDSEAGWGLLEASLRRAELNSANKAAQDESYKDLLVKIKETQSRLDDVQSHESIVSLLELIDSAAHYASTAPDASLPKKRNTDNAKRNQLVLDINKYLQYHFGTDSPALIATIVNTAFEPFKNGGVTADDVRMLIA